MAKKILHLGVWNIEGLTNKLDNPDFISKIKDFDLISVVETWLPYGSQKPPLEVKDIMRLSNHPGLQSCKMLCYQRKLKIDWTHYFFHIRQSIVQL